MINSIINTARDTKRTLYVEKVLKGRLERFDVNMPVSRHVMSSEMKRDYIAYYRSFGFRHVSTKWVELIYGATGKYDRRIVPEDIFNLYIDPVYPDIRDYWQNKSYQPSIVPGLRYPETVVRIINGYFVNSNHEIISERDALNMVQQHEAVVIKPTIFTGGGINVRSFS